MGQTLRRGGGRIAPFVPIRLCHLRLCEWAIFLPKFQRRGRGQNKKNSGKCVVLCVISPNGCSLVFIIQGVSFIIMQGLSSAIFNSISNQQMHNF